MRDDTGMRGDCNDFGGSTVSGEATAKYHCDNVVTTFLKTLTEKHRI